MIRSALLFLVMSLGSIAAAQNSTVAEPPTLDASSDPVLGDKLHAEVWNGLYHAMVNQHYHLSQMNWYSNAAWWAKVALAVLAIIGFCLPFLLPQLVDLKFPRWSFSWGFFGLVCLLVSIGLSYCEWETSAFKHQLLYQRWSSLTNNWRALFVQNSQFNNDQLSSRITALRVEQEAIEGAEPAAFDYDAMSEAQTTAKNLMKFFKENVPPPLNEPAERSASRDFLNRS